MPNALKTVLTFVLVATAQQALAGTAAFTPLPKVEFSPATGQSFTLPYRVSEPARVTVEIFTADGDLVRTLTSSDEPVTGDQTLEWDGKDEHGQIVPNEAYVPVLTARFADGEVVADPRLHSGGEVVDNIPVRILNDSDIEYQLPAPSRVLIRIGIGGGAMLHSLANWAPRPSGSNFQRWDGYDRDRVKRIAGHADTKVLVTAFRLPEHSIIVSGRNDMSYSQYRELRGWPVREVKTEDMALQRDGVRLSRSYYLPRAYSSDPTVAMSIVEDVKRNAAGDFVVSGPVTLRVDVAERDRWLLKNSLFEVAFFVDFEFVSEEESGYVPLSWRWNPVGLAPGRHIVTVNISGFLGQVGVHSIAVEIPAD